MKAEQKHTNKIQKRDNYYYHYHAPTALSQGKDPRTHWIGG
jgi:hypothetical protein